MAIYLLNEYIINENANGCLFKWKFFHNCILKTFLVITDLSRYLFAHNYL